MITHGREMTHLVVYSTIKRGQNNAKDHQEITQQLGCGNWGPSAQGHQSMRLAVTSVLFILNFLVSFHKQLYTDTIIFNKAIASVLYQYSAFTIISQHELHKPFQIHTKLKHIYHSQYAKSTPESYSSFEMEVVAENLH